MVKLRLQRKGRKSAPFYHIVVADSRSPRDGKFIEKIGTYNPMTQPATIVLDNAAAFEWLGKGAQPTDTVAAILRFKGVMYEKHLMRGVKKGALTVEQAEAKLKEWIDSKESKVAGRAEAVKVEKKAKLVAISGVAKPKPIPVVVAPVVEEAPAAPVVEAVIAPVVAEAVAPVVEEVVAPVVAAVEAVPVVEEVAAVAVTEVAAPVVEEVVAAVEPVTTPASEETPAAAGTSEETPA